MAKTKNIPNREEYLRFYALVRAIESKLKERNA